MWKFNHSILNNHNSLNNHKAYVSKENNKYLKSKEIKMP